MIDEKIKVMNYETAIQRLQEIVSQMEHDELDIDSLTEKLKEAQQLVKLCTDKLTKTDAEIKKLLEKES